MCSWQSGVVYACALLATSIALLISGCPRGLNDACVWKHPFRGVVYNTTIDAWECGRATTDTYCYDVIVRAHPVDGNYTVVGDYCENTVADHLEYLSSAQSVADDYFVGKRVDWVRTDRSHECVSYSDAEDVFYAGVGMLGVTAFVALLAVRCWAADRDRDRDHDPQSTGDPVRSQ